MEEKKEEKDERKKCEGENGEGDGTEEFGGCRMGMMGNDRRDIGRECR